MRGFALQINIGQHAPDFLVITNLVKRTKIAMVGPYEMYEYNMVPLDKDVVITEQTEMRHEIEVGELAYFLHQRTEALSGERVAINSSGLNYLLTSYR
jgi:hypothetical protein